jgi:predicted ATP-grasp superfamily ATP-dependent carboligase
MSQKVVIVGHGSTSRLGIVRSLSEIDCEITLVVMSFLGSKDNPDKTTPFDCYSRYVSHVYYNYYKDGEGLIRLLIDKCADPEQKVVLLPDSDFSAAVIDNHREMLKDSFVFPHVINEPHSVQYWMNKSNQKKLAEELGLHYSKGTTIEVKDGTYSWPVLVSYPCFTKALVTISGGKQYFRKCDCETDLRKLLSYVASREDASILAEEYINIETEYALLGFSDGREVVIPGVIKFITNSKSHFGIAMKGEILPVTGFEDLLEQFKRFVLHVGFVGVFDIDFFWGDGKWWFGELNLRFGGSGYAVTKMGVNLPVMLVKCLTGKSYVDMPKHIEGSATYINERMCLDDWYRGIITTKEYHKISGNADISFVRDDTDTKPQKVFERMFRKMQLKKTIKSILGK